MPIGNCGPTDTSATSYGTAARVAEHLQRGVQRLVASTSRRCQAVVKPLSSCRQGS